jgi:tetratricopeptide (TPR) repeat protein
MKTFLRNWVITFTLALIYTVSGSAQAYLVNPKFGPDEETRLQCATSINLYEEHYKARNYDLAKPHWMNVLKICPAASENTYVRGKQMLKTWIGQERDIKRRNILIDSLMLIYDLQIEYFGKKGSLLGQKANDLLVVEPDRYEESYNILAESLDIEKENSSPVVILSFMDLSKKMYENKKIGADKVIETYSLLADYLDLQISAKPDDDRIVQVKANVDALFSSANVADCDNLTAIFGPRIEANSSDLDLLKKTFSLLSANRCESTPFYRKVSELLFAKEPTPARANELAKIYAGLREFDKSENYYQEAIKLETDSEKKSIYLVDYANIMFYEFKKPQQARSLALQALSENPNMGHAYRLIGNIYVSVRDCGPDEFTRRAVYWLAVDKYILAKQVDPNLEEQCDKLIETYSQQFPPDNEIFFNLDLKGEDYVPGKRYPFLVGCWINEYTTTRGRP